MDNDELLWDETKVLDYVTDCYQTFYNSKDICGHYDLFYLQADILDENEKEWH